MDKKSANKKPQDQRDEKGKYNSDVTKEDVDALGSKELSMDTGDDRLLEKRKGQPDFSGKDLDVPGRDTANNKASSKKLKDEENTLYGQGSESNEGLEAPERANSDKNK